MAFVHKPNNGKTVQDIGDLTVKTTSTGMINRPINNYGQTSKTISVSGQNNMNIRLTGINYYG